MLRHIILRALFKVNITNVCKIIAAYVVIYATLSCSCCSLTLFSYCLSCFSTHPDDFHADVLNWHRYGCKAQSARLKRDRKYRSWNAELCDECK